MSYATMRRAVIATAALVAAMVTALPAAHAGDDQGAPEYYNSGLAPTPYMGWNSYYGLGAPTEPQVKGVADFLASSGLKDAGYTIVWLDGGWQAPTPRDASGKLVADPERFPSGIPSLVTHLHKQGFKVGIYTEAGAYDGKNCGLGSGGYYEADAKQFAAWKVDAIKIDFLCAINQNLDPGTAFSAFSAAVQKAGRPMLLNICNPVTWEWGIPHTPAQEAGRTYSFGPRIADSWRTSTDIAFGTAYPDQWKSLLRNMDDNQAHPEAAGPGHFNDPDYLLPMRATQWGGYEFNEEESNTQLVMWAQMAAPLVIGSDPRTLPPSMIASLKNPEILAVNQDPLVIQGVRVANNSTGDVYSKVLSGRGQRSVVLLNRSDAAAEMTVDFSAAGLSGNVKVRDLRARADRGPFDGSYTTTVPAHGTAMLKLSGTDLVPGTDIGGSPSASPALVRFDDGNALAFIRGAAGDLQVSKRDGENWSGKWTSLGGPRGARILGQPAAYGSAGGRVDVFVRGTDNAVYQRTFKNGKWCEWAKLGGSVTDAPTVAFTSPDSWTLVARGADGKVWQRGNNSGWSTLDAPNGQPVYGRPSAAVANGVVHVAVRTADDAVWERARDAAGTWGAWSDLGGVISGSPTLLATEGRVYLFARASDYTLWQRNFADGSWGGWFKRDEFPSNAFTGALGTAAGANGAAWVAVRGSDGRVHQSVL
jgi:alpha-galactosidase